MRLKGARKKWVEVVNLWITPGVSIEHDRNTYKIIEHIPRYFKM